MAYVSFIDSFDYYETADILKKWDAVSGTVAIEATGGRRNSGYLKITPAYSTRVTKIVTTSAYITVGCAVKLSASDLVAGRQNIILFLANSDTPQLFLSILPDSKLLEVRRHAVNGTYPDRNESVLLGTSATALTMDTWQHIELGVYLANSGSFELRINGSSVAGIPSTNADTYYTGTCNRVGLGTPTAQLYGELYYGVGNFDDFRVTYGDELLQLGDRRIDYLALTANDTQQDFTVSSGNAWEALNGNGENIQSDTLNDISRFVLADLSHAPLSIDTVQLVAEAQKSDSGDRAIALLAKSDTTESASADLYLSQSVATKTAEFQTDPDTEAAWTEGGLNALIVGVKVTV
jgi:hypothetical protein